MTIQCKPQAAATQLQQDSPETIVTATGRRAFESICLRVRSGELTERAFAMVARALLA